MAIVCTYQAFLQRLVQMVALGYHFYSISIRPSTKTERAVAIDQKLFLKYPCLNANTDQRTRRRKKGLLRAEFVRYQNFQVILRTDGADDSNLIQGERWHDARRRKLVLPGIWKSYDFVIFNLDGHWTVSLNKPCWRQVKGRFVEMAENKPKHLVAHQFELLDQELPSWKGLYRQKRFLQKKLVNAIRARGGKASVRDFPVRPKRHQFGLEEMPGSEK